jgi:hypothetical protein
MMAIVKAIASFIAVAAALPMSAPVATRVAEAASKNLIPVVLELGGKDPMIVLEDAKLENAARAAIWGAFCNSGQACASIERCYVHESIAPQFIDLVVKETRALRQGNPAAEGVDVGAMTNERQLQIVERHVNDAIEKGARVETGGRRLTGSGGWFHEPTVVTNVDHSMDLMTEETFGPVLPIMTFKTDDEAGRLANDSNYGPTASGFTNDGLVLGALPTAIGPMIELTTAHDPTTPGLEGAVGVQTIDERTDARPPVRLHRTDGMSVPPVPVLAIVLNAMIALLIPRSIPMSVVP